MNTIYSHSGAIFEITKSGTIVKYALDICHSANKQLSFNTNGIFNTPHIFDISQHCFEMEYIEGAITLSEYFQFVDANEVRGVIDKLISFVRHNTTYHTDVDSVIFTNKINGVILKLSNREQLEAGLTILRALNKITNVRIIGGAYHGDLTFSNVLITPKKQLILIDFLPGYVQSVELDYVKLLQECKLKWSSLLNKDVIGNYFYACEYLQQRIKEVYKPRTQIIEAINYLRILPYVKNDAIGAILCNEINNILQ